MTFFSAAGQARQSDREKGVEAEGAVSTLLAALGKHHGKMAPMVFIAGLAYLARVTAQCASEFLSVTRANWYRLTTTAILVAAKVYDEHSSSRLNACFARSSGIPLSEMTRMEVDFLYLFDFDLLLKESEVEEWLKWMETLALRCDLMTPLNTYVLGTSASTMAGPRTSTRKSSVTGCTTFTEYEERRKTCAMCEASRTPGLSSEVVEGEEETVGTPLSSMVVQCSVLQAPVASSTANSRCLTSAAAATDVPSLTAPFADLSSFPPRSSASSVQLPGSVLEETFSAVSAASVPGGEPSFLSDRRTCALALPSHCTLSLCPPTAKRRLFSVVHGTDGPPSPISVRQLCRRGGSPPSPLRPPSVGRHPSVRFFKSQSTHAHGLSRHATGTVSYTELGMHGAEDGGDKVSKLSCRDQVTRVDKADTAGRASAPAASHQQKKRWGPFGMVQQVRDVLGVTASLVRGQLDVLAPSAQAEELSRLPPPQQDEHQSTSKALRSCINNISESGGRVSLQPQSFAAQPCQTISGGRCPPFPANLMGEPKPWVCGAPSATAVASRSPVDSPPQPGAAASARRRGGPATPGGVAKRSPMPRRSLQYEEPCFLARTQSYTRTVATATVAQPSGAAAAADGVYADSDSTHEEYDEGYEEGEYGHYDQSGYFHYYEDDEGVEGEYDEYYDEEDEEGAWYEEDEEDEAAYFQRCRPPLSHSPPSL
ncbi:cyc2-like cyclin, putative [Leishmania tarentolae]|uniref:Cyc2-like cyclin, putative n=1 Tax=Leishmania tarentolae TaxID=5689 RepID=A0A640KW85_LEITA|nr:cyc2-like cyclin, putative [Leishmania tarentolae]